MEHVAPVLILFAMCLLVGWIVWVVSNTRRRSKSEASQAEIRGQVMKPCKKEPSVVDAIRARQWEKSLRDHVAACSACADLVLVSRFMDEEAKSQRRASQPGLPSPGLIWWKAQPVGMNH